MAFMPSAAASAALPAVWDGNVGAASRGAGEIGFLQPAMGRDMIDEMQGVPFRRVGTDDFTPSRQVPGASEARIADQNAGAWDFQSPGHLHRDARWNLDNRKAIGGEELAQKPEKGFF